MRYTKTPMQMRLAAGRGNKPPSKPLGPPDTSRRPIQSSEDDPDVAIDAASAWLAHVQAGRITVR